MLWGTKLPRDIVVGYYFPVQISFAINRWAGWALAHLEFGVSVNPFTLFQPEVGADCAHCITACPSGFENLTTSLFMEQNFRFGPVLGPVLGPASQFCKMNFPFFEITTLCQP